MPAEIESHTPAMTPEQWKEIISGVPRERAAARLILASRVGGIPHKPYLTGASDHAPVLKGVEEFCALVYNLIEALDDNLSEHDPATVAASNAVTRAMEEFKG